MASYQQSDIPRAYWDKDNEADGLGATPPGQNRRRRMMRCQVVEDSDIAVSQFFSENAKANDPHKSTHCMNHHVMARLEDDVRRARMREENPASAIPDRGPDYDEEAYRAVAEYRATQQLPRRACSIVNGLYTPPRPDGFLPAISPLTGRSRRDSASNSTGTSVARQRRDVREARSPGRVSPAPSQQRSPSRGQRATGPVSPASRRPAGGRLQPIENSGGSRSPSRGRTDAGSRQKLVLDSFDMPDGDAGLVSEAERQRRLRLAEELAMQMDAVEV